jgi:hypothetical protein
MDKGGVNIDIVFRNGLKDFEVLPPQEVWDTIQPAIKIKQRPFIFLKIAALITVILSLSFFAYKWSSEFSTKPERNVMALNMTAPSPIIVPVFTKPITDIRKENSFIQDNQISVAENIQVGLPNHAIENNTSPASVLLPVSGSLALNNPKTLNLQLLASFNSSKDIVYNNSISEPDQQYSPATSSTLNGNRWSISAIASPTYYSKFYSGNDELSKQLNLSEENILSYSGGVGFSYKVNKRLSIQSGLFYSSVGQAIDGISSFAGFQKFVYTKGNRNFEVLTTSGTVYTNNGDVFLVAGSGYSDRVITAYTNDVFDPKKESLQYMNNTIKQNFSYLELPVVLRYKLIDKKIDFNIIGGISYNMLVNNSVYTMIDGTKYPIGKTEGLNQISFSSSFGMGMEYNFSDNLSLNMEPTFRYYLNPFNQVTGSKAHPYLFGIFSGVSYKF